MSTLCVAIVRNKKKFDDKKNEEVLTCMQLLE